MSARKDTRVGRLTIRWCEIERLWNCWDGTRVIEASTLKGPLVEWARRKVAEEAIAKRKAERASR